MNRSGISVSIWQKVWTNRKKRGLEEFALCHSPTCLLPNVYDVNKEYAEQAIMEHCLCAHPGKCIYSIETISKRNIKTKGE